MDAPFESLAKRIHIPHTRIEHLVKTETSLTVNTAMRLAKVFNTTVEYWMNPTKGMGFGSCARTD